MSSSELEGCRGGHVSGGDQPQCVSPPPQHNLHPREQSPLHPSKGGIPRPACRTPRQRAAGPPRSPHAHALTPSPTRHGASHSDGNNNNNNGSSTNSSGRYGSASGVALSVDDATSMLSNAMYRHERGSRGFSAEPSSSWSLASSNRERWPSPQQQRGTAGTDAGGGHPPSSFSSNVTFTSGDVSRDDGSRPPTAPLHSLVDFTSMYSSNSSLRWSGRRRHRAATTHGPTSRELVYRPPGNRDAVVAVPARAHQGEEEKDGTTSPVSQQAAATHRGTSQHQRRRVRNSNNSSSNHYHLLSHPNAETAMSATKSSSHAPRASSAPQQRRSTTDAHLSRPHTSSAASSATSFDFSGSNDDTHSGHAAARFASTQQSSNEQTDSSHDSSSSGGGGAEAADARQHRPPRGSAPVSPWRSSRRRPSHLVRDDGGGMSNGTTLQGGERGDGGGGGGGLRRRRGRRHNNNSSVHAAGGPYQPSDETAAARRLPVAPLSRRPVVSWRSHARVCAVTSVPSGQVLTGGDATGLIEVWDGRTGRLLCCLSGHQAPVLALLTIPDTSLLLSGSADRTARLWELRTLQNTMVLEGHRGLITALASLWMPDVGLNLFTGSDDGTVRQWRAATGACVHVYDGHLGPINVVASLRPVKYIATGGSDGLLKLWNAQTLRCLSSTAAVPLHSSTTTTMTAATMASGAAAAAVAATASSAHAYSNKTNYSRGGGGAEGTGAYGGGLSAGSSGSRSRGAVWDISQLNDGDQSIVTATDDGAVRLWASQWYQNAYLLKEIYLPGVLLKARSGARRLLVCGTYLFVGGARGELFVWDTESIPYLSPVGRRHHAATATGGGGDGGYTHSGFGSYRAMTSGHGSAGGGGAGSVASAALHPGAAGGTNSAAQAEFFSAAFLFHTAAITGLTQQGAHMVSSSLDHTICRWSLHSLVRLEGGAAMNAMIEKGLGFGLAFSAAQGWSSPFSWAMRLTTASSSSSSLPLTWDAGGGLYHHRSGGPPGNVHNGFTGSSGVGADAVLWPLVGGGSATTPPPVLQQDPPRQQLLLLPPVAQGPFASPLALLRNPKSLLEGDAAVLAAAAAAAADTGTSNRGEAPFIELSPGEAAAAYTELPLTFLVEHLRSAAVSPVDVRSVLRAVLLLLYVALFVVFYNMGLLPVVKQGSDITNSMFSQTATYPLPSFARPNTFASITSGVLLERWLMLMMDQLHSLAVPVEIVLPALQNSTLHNYSTDTDVCVFDRRPRDSSGRRSAKASPGQSKTHPPKSRSSPVSGTAEDGGGDATDAAELSSTDLRAGTPASPKVTTTLINLPAMPGGVALLRHARVRVKLVTGTSCTWNRHFLRRASSGKEAFAEPPPCYGELRRSTELRETLCPAGTPATPHGGSVTGLSKDAALGCLPYTTVNAGVAFTGLFNTYDTGGYILSLPFYSNKRNISVLYAPVEAMRRLGLVDEQRTRLVDVVIFSYHIHSHTFMRLHYVLEVPRGGAWIASTDTRPCPLYNFSTSLQTRLTLGCVVIMLILLLFLIGLMLYEIVMAYFVGGLLHYCLSFAVLVDAACFTLGMCVIGYSFRWIVVSRAINVDTLLRASATSAVFDVDDNLLARHASPAYAVQIHQLNKVATAFNGLATCAALEAVLLFLCVTITAGGLVTFLQVIETAMRQLRVQLITAAATMVLVVVAFALAFHLLYGSRQYAYASLIRAVWHLLLYFASSQSVNTDVAPPLATDRRTTSKVLLFVLNYVCRVLWFVYLLSLVVGRVQAVARGTPHISNRALLTKWWYDVQYQLALMRQRSPDTLVGGGGGNNNNSSTSTAGTPSADATETGGRRSRKHRTAEGEEAGSWKDHSRTLSRASHLSTSGHRRVIIDYVWRRLRSLQHDHEKAQQRRFESSLTATNTTATLYGSPGKKDEVSGSGVRCQNSTTSISHFLNRHSDMPAVTASASAAAAFSRIETEAQADESLRPGTTSTLTSITAEASFTHLHLRLTDLLLLLSEKERTPFARNVIRHAWESLAWMYHYHQQHTRAQYPEERQRRVRLDAGIRHARLQLEPLFAVVRATQARLEAHEARLRPLAKAVEEMAAGDPQ